MKQYMLTVFGTPGKFDGYSQMFKDSKKAGKAFARTIANNRKSSLIEFVGNCPTFEINNV